MSLFKARSCSSSEDRGEAPLPSGTSEIPTQTDLPLMSSASVQSFNRSIVSSTVLALELFSSAGKLMTLASLHALNQNWPLLGMRADHLCSVMRLLQQASDEFCIIKQSAPKLKDILSKVRPRRLLASFKVRDAESRRWWAAQGLRQSWGLGELEGAQAKLAHRNVLRSWATIWACIAGRIWELGLQAKASISWHMIINNLSCRSWIWAPYLVLCPLSAEPTHLGEVESPLAKCHLNRIGTFFKWWLITCGTWTESRGLQVEIHIHMLSPSWFAELVTQYVSNHQRDTIKSSILDRPRPHQSHTQSLPEWNS